MKWAPENSNLVHVLLYQLSGSLEGASSFHNPLASCLPSIYLPPPTYMLSRGNIACPAVGRHLDIPFFFLSGKFNFCAMDYNSVEDAMK